MGTAQIASAPSTGGKIFYKMLHLLLLLSASSMAKASYGPALGLGPDIGPRYGYSSGYQQQHTCHTVYDSATDAACHTEQDQVCHTEFDTVVDTTYVEDCQDIVTEQCHQVSQQVHHSSGVVGHNSQVLPGSYGGHPVGKREAKPSYGAIGGHTTGPQCHANTERQCQQRPVQNARQIPRQACHPVPRQVCVPTAREVCVPVPRQVCVPVETKIPRQECQTSRAHVSQHGYPGEDQGYLAVAGLALGAGATLGAGHGIAAGAGGYAYGH